MMHEMPKENSRNYAGEERRDRRAPIYATRVSSLLFSRGYRRGPRDKFMPFGALR